jgi:hypothetical protein
MTLADHYAEGDDPIYKLLIEHEAMIYATLKKDD